MKKWIITLFFVIPLFLLAACVQSTPTATPGAPELRFDPRVTMFEEGKVNFEIGVTNEANSPSPDIDNANIRAVITGEDGKIRNQMTIYELGSIPAGERVAPLLYEAVYDPGQYVMSLTGEDIPSLALTFEIREEGGVRMLAAPREYINPHTEFTIDAAGLSE